MRADPSQDASASGPAGGPVTRGTTPPGAHDEREAAVWVREMFGRVAHRYDLANHLLSFNIDRYWRAHTARRVKRILERPEARVLDICCGTGDLLLALAKASPPGRPTFGSDFCHPMLTAARAKTMRRSVEAPLFEADALRLPVRDASLDLITAAFGFRNLANYGAGLEELRRVLRPGGMAAILEFSQPSNAVFAKLYGFYSRRICRKSARRFPGRRMRTATCRNPCASFRKPGNWRMKCDARGSGV